MVVAVVMVEHFVLIKEEEVYKEEEEKICLSVLVAMKGKEEGFG